MTTYPTAHRRLTGSLLGVVAAVLLLLLIACSPSAAGGDQRRGDEATVREDTPPITRRFAALGDITQVRWLAGTNDTWLSVGPATYTIKAVITLAPGTGRHLANQYPLKPTNAPDVPTPLQPFLPPAPTWSAADDLDQSVGTGWNSQIVLDVDTDVAYLSAEGQR